MNIINSTLPRLDQIKELQEKIATLPQLDILTEHYFLKGVYCRKITVPENSIIVGKIHKKENIFIMAKGRMLVTSQFDSKEVVEGDMFVSQEGVKRVGYALTECVCINVHRTDETDLVKIEEELIEKEELLLYDAKNIMINNEVEQ